MKKATGNTKTSTTKTRKYIVEAPEPMKGQTASSGGIRGKNGKLTAQYKNPVPYQKPAQTPAIPTRTRKDEIRDQMADYALNRAGEAVSTILDEWLWPVIRAKIQVQASKAMNSINEKFNQSKSNQHTSPMHDHTDIIDVDTDDLRETDDDNDKIIRFPGGRAV